MVTPFMVFHLDLINENILEIEPNNYLRQVDNAYRKL